MFLDLTKANLTPLTEQQVKGAFKEAYRRIPKTYRDSDPKFYLNPNGVLIGDWRELDSSFVWHWNGKKWGPIVK